MQSTVKFPVRTRPIRTGGAIETRSWANYEVIPYLDQSRKAHNMSYRAQFTLETTPTGLPQAIWAYEVPTGIVLHAEVTVLAHVTAGGDGRSVFVFRGTFQTDTALTQEGPTAPIYTQNTLGLTAAFLVTGANLGVVVTDDGLRSISWRAEVEVREHPLP